MVTPDSWIESLTVIDLGFVAVGASVGLLVGLTGVGGGSLMTPILTQGFGITPAVAVGTDLAFAAVTKSAGAVVHGLQGSVRWNAVLFLLAGALPAAIFVLVCLEYSHGALVSSNVSPYLAKTIKLAMGGCVLLTALSLMFRPQLLAWVRASPSRSLSPKVRAWALGIAGGVIGGLVALTSIGAGAIGATVIALLHPEWDTAEVAGTDIAYAIPLTGVAAIGHAHFGTVDTTLLLGLLIGSVPAIALGSALSKRLPERLTRYVLVMALCAASASLFGILRFGASA